MTVISGNVKSGVDVPGTLGSITESTEGRTLMLPPETTYPFPLQAKGAVRVDMSVPGGYWA